MIEAQDLTKRYAGRTAVDAISFSVKSGEIVGFLGPNGAGKSTTMRMLSGYMPPTSGSALVAGFDIFRESMDVRKNVGYMPENAPLYGDLRVKEYLHFRAELKGLRGREMRRRTGEVMDMCGVTDMRRRLICNLSKGYRQRVALADTLLHQPQLLILDEPTNGLDPTQIRHVREMLMGLKDRQTVLLSTHILSEVEKICDRVIMIHHGRIRACDTPQNLTRQLRAAATVCLEVKGEGKMTAKLEDLPGVRKAEEQPMPDGWRGITVRVEAQCDPREAILELATKENWKIREMHQELPTLEDVFVELAASDAPPPEE